jgi:hypothetical protein
VDRIEPLSCTVVTFHDCLELCLMTDRDPGFDSAWYVAVCGFARLLREEMHLRLVGSCSGWVLRRWVVVCAVADDPCVPKVGSVVGVLEGAILFLCIADVPAGFLWGTWMVFHW